MEPTKVPSMFDKPAGHANGTAGNTDFAVHSLQGPEGTEIRAAGGSNWRSNPQNWDDAPPCA